MCVRERERDRDRDRDRQTDRQTEIYIVLFLTTNGLNNNQCRTHVCAGQAVAFFVQFTEYHHTFANDNTVLKFDDVRTNVGNAYHSDTGGSCLLTC